MTCILIRDAWLKTKHINRLLTTDETSRQHKIRSGFYSNLQAQIHMHTRRSIHTFTRGAWLKTKHLNWLLTKDEISRQHKTCSGFHSNLRAQIHIHTVFDSHINSGCLTWDETSQPAADNRRNIQTAQDPLRLSFKFTSTDTHTHTAFDSHINSRYLT